ncbi:PREDICTED: LOW QUALITY PROTEIN: uncharacterized protein LOC108547303 [Eufriesea mexicana]|uniref:LOW QUALITY PROTEIN: uncharacterized protein LOC108547303 n=1 Tax=Eufriesea mexicana TaxID=516756 RepID=UPI00083C7C67|nr:PREDICTED: LOW QUALITY PROTEIN: uncharacterized protein LOC108547303 [Eufriesea mexicana]
MLTYAEHVSRLLRDHYCYTMPYIVALYVPRIQRSYMFCVHPYGSVTKLTGFFLIHDPCYIKQCLRIVQPLVFRKKFLRVRWGRENMERKRSILALIGLILFLKSSNVESGNGNGNNEHLFSHHRQKRLFWITNDGRIALPPGTIMTITPTLALPFVRYPPYGFLSNMTVSLPFTIDFDKLGLTDNENPYGVLPSAFDATAREQGPNAAEFIATFVKRAISKREAIADLPKNALYGGERALLYGTAEDMLANFGLNGKACLLRAICEVQGHPLSNFGLIGEMLKLFFTASKSPFSNLLKEYVEAENRGKFHGECWPYFKDCPKSLFRASENKYTKEAFHENDASAETDGIEQKRYRYFPSIQSIDRTRRDTQFSQNFKRTIHPSM